MCAAKTGRPPIENPRQVQKRIRLTQSEADMLKECAEKLNTTQTNVVVMGIQTVYKGIKK